MKLELGSLKKQRKQLISLAVLAALLGVVYYYEFGQQTGTATPASNAQVAATTPTGSAGPGPLPKPVALGRLDPVPGETTSTRNPFRFGVPPPPPVVYHPPPPPPPPPPPVQVPTGPPPKPRIPLKFEGVIERKGYGKMAVLVYADGAGKDSGVMQGREGDVIDGQYRIVKIGLNSITMEYLDGTGQQVIALSGT